MGAECTASENPYTLISSAQHRRKGRPHRAGFGHRKGRSPGLDRERLLHQRHACDTVSLLRRLTSSLRDAEPGSLQEPWATCSAEARSCDLNTLLLSRVSSFPLEKMDPQF